MTDELTVSDDLLDDYIQIGNSDRVDVAKPGTGIQVVDTTELFASKEAKDYTEMVTGVEQLLLGTMDRKVGVMLGYDKAKDLDPFPSDYNLRKVMGQEGFFSKIYESIEKAITWVIKFVANCIRWIVNMFKTILGLKPTDRQEQAIEAGVEELSKRLTDLADKMGLPRHMLDPKAYIGNLPMNSRIEPQLNLIKNRLVSDDEHVTKLIEVAHLVPKIYKKLEGVLKSLNRSIDKYNKTIETEYTKFIKVTQDPQLRKNRTLDDSTEVINIRRALTETRLLADVEEVKGPIVEFLTKLYDVKFNDEAMDKGLKDVTKQLDQNLLNATALMSKIDNDAGGGLRNFMEQSAILEDLKAARAANEVNITGKDWANLRNFANVDTVNKVKEIGDWYGDTTITALYLQTADVTKDYVSYVSMVSRELLRYRTQIDNLIQYRQRLHLFITGMLLKDVEYIKNAGVDINEVDLKVMGETTAQTVGEGIAQFNRDLLGDEQQGLIKVYNNLAKQLRLDTL